MAASLKNRSFTNLADKNDGVLGDDFVHGALETWKLKGKTSNGGKVDYKAKIKHSQKDGQLSGNLSDELKVQFPYDKYFFWFGSRRSGDLKIHADLGNVNVAGKEFNVFSNLKTNINFKNFAFRFGANYFGNNLTASSRLETACSPSSSCGHSLALTSRLWTRKNDVTYAVVTSLGLNDGVSLNKYDALVGFERDNTNIYLQHDSNKKSSQIALGTLTATATYSKDKNTFGIEASNDFQANKQAASLAVATKVNGATAKAKVNNNLDLELAWKKQINKQLNVTASGKLALSKGAKAVDFTQYVPIPFGVQFEVNV